MTGTRNSAGGLYAVAPADKRKDNRPTVQPTGKTQAQRRLERMDKGAAMLAAVLALDWGPFGPENPSGYAQDDDWDDRPY